MTNTNFVLVHIQRSIFPEYIYTCIEQIRITNRNADIYLAFYSSCEGIDYDRLNASKCHLIDLKKHIWSIMHLHFKLKNRGIFTTERFFVIHEIMKQHHLSNVIHIENDVMIYADINNFMKVLNENYDLGFVRESDEICIAGFVYIKNAKFLRTLCQHFLHAKNVSDMVSISRYGHKEGLHYLPVVSKGYTQKEEMTFENFMGKRIPVKEKDVYCENVEKFGCVFDGCAYGQYVGGVDPRGNGKPIVGYINQQACHNAEKCSIIWEKVNGLRVPFYVYGEEKLPIANLHIHSKELEKYRSDTIDNEVDVCNE